VDVREEKRVDCCMTILASACCTRCRWGSHDLDLEHKVIDNITAEYTSPKKHIFKKSPTL